MPVTGLVLIRMVAKPFCCSRPGQMLWATTALCLQTCHGSKEKDQDADGDERQGRTRQKFCYPIETLAASGLRECKQGQDESDAITDHRDGHGGLRSPACRGTRKRTAQEAEPKEEKGRESKFAQVIQAPPA